jgi:hypothetical protein
MKNLQSIITFLFAVFSISMNAQTTVNNGVREAAMKGKADLIKILSENRDFNFGVSAKDVEAAQVSNPIEIFSTDFNKLLGDNGSNITTVSRSESVFIVPFANNGRVITTVSVASDSKGTKVVELVNQQYSSELNELPAEIKRANFRGLRFIHVPNIQATVYIFEDKCYTSYNGRSLREGISISEISRQLQNDAKVFQTRFGEELKKGKLVR